MIKKLEKTEKPPWWAGYVCKTLRWRGAKRERRIYMIMPLNVVARFFIGVYWAGYAVCKWVKYG